MSADKIQDIRNLTRPILTWWFAFAFTSLTAFIIVYGLLTGKMDYKEALLALEGVLSVLGTIVGYHFGKSSKVDNEIPANQDK